MHAVPPKGARVLAAPRRLAQRRVYRGALVKADRLPPLALHLVRRRAQLPEAVTW